MKHVILTTLLLLIFGITFVGCHATVNPKIERELDSAASIENYSGPQTVESLMEAFDARYSSRAANTKWAMDIVMLEFPKSIDSITKMSLYNFGVNFGILYNREN